MALRSVWKGNITFLLVSVAIKVYTAIESAEKISFNQLHAGDCQGQVGHKQQCKKCNEVVGKDEIVKGYKHAEDQFVVVSPEEIAAITPASNKTIEILGFINRSEIPDTFFDSPYLATPDGAASGKPYALLKAVMQRTNKVAIGKVILREREDLVAISATGEGLTIQTLRYAREVRTFAGLPAQEQSTPSNEELELATALVERLQTTFDQIDTTDHFHAALREMLDTKIAGGEIETTAKIAARAPVIDIMEALKASLNANTQTPAENTAGPQLTLVANDEMPARKGRRKAAA